MRLDGRKALVTGAQQGIGRAIAIAFARAGADVAVNWLDDEAAAGATAAAVTAAGRRAELVQGSVGTADEARAIVNAAARSLGGLDVLVNNAGVFPRVPMLEMEESDWDHVLNINLRGSFFCAQAAARIMVANGTHGAIMHLASRAIGGGSPRGVHYTASKGGIVAMTRAMALELAPYRIRVNSVAPGLTDTAQPRYGSSEEQLALRSAETPLGRMAQPEDIADVALFLATDAARHITGQTIHVNGGSYLP